MGIRDLVAAIVAVCVAIAGGFYWGWHERGSSFDRQKIALEAAVRARAAKQARELAAELAETKAKLEQTEQAAEAADAEKSKAIDQIAEMLDKGTAVTKAELDAINRTIEQVAR